MDTTSPDRTAYWLRRDTVERVLDTLCWSQEGLADEVGISRVHFNRLLNRRRPLTRKSRRKLLDCPRLAGFSPDDLWTRESAGDRE